MSEEEFQSPILKGEEEQSSTPPIVQDGNTGFLSNNTNQWEPDYKTKEVTKHVDGNQDFLDTALEDCSSVVHQETHHVQHLTKLVLQLNV